MSTVSRPGRVTTAHLVAAFVFVAIGNILTATTRLDISILLPETMRALNVASLAVGGLIGTVTVLGDGLTEPLFGFLLVDRVDRRKALALGLTTFSVFSLLTAAAGSLGLMIVFRILLGVGQGMFLPAYFAFVGGAFTRRRGLLVGGLTSLYAVGIALNPVVTRGVFLATGGQWQAPYVFYGLVGLLVAAGVAWLGRGGVFELRGRSGAEAAAAGQQAPAERPAPAQRPAPATGAPAAAHHASRTDITLALTAMVFIGLFTNGFIFMFVPFLRLGLHFSLGEAVSVASIAGWTTFLLDNFGGWLSDHIGRRTCLLIFTVMALLLAYPAFGLSTSFTTALIFGSLFQAAGGVSYILGISYAQDMARAGRLGGYSGTASGIFHAVGGVSGYIVGAIAAAAGFRNVSWLFLGCTVVILACILGTRDPHRHVVALAEGSQASV